MKLKNLSVTETTTRQEVKPKEKLTDYVPHLESAPDLLLRQESVLSLETDPARRHGEEHTLVLC